MPKKNNKTISLYDASTGQNVEVIVANNGKLFLVEGLSAELIKAARQLALSRSSNGCSEPLELQNEG